MSNNLFLDFKPQDDTSDSLSNSVPSLTYFPFEDSSPINFQSTNSTEHEVLDKTKKIRKKRNAYHKIDDNIRLLLLEAVQRGETLKSAAKRYQVNYSSAKSIFHIYKKEGRILKKATQERDFPLFGPPSDVPHHFMPNQNPNPMPNPKPIPTQVPMREYYQRSIFLQPCQPEPLQQGMDQGQQHTNGDNNETENTNHLNDLVDNFSELLRLESEPKPKEDPKTRKYEPMTPSRFLPAITSPVNRQFYRPAPVHSMNLASKAPSSGMLVSPADKLKHFDNFYMNYSNSPLSGRNGKMIKEGSESGSNRNLEREFESFSEMMNAFQSQNYLTESLKDFSVAKLIIPETPKEKMEVKTPTPKNREEEFHWGLEGAALDTYKSFMDAQNTLTKNFHNTPYYNNLIQLQRLRMDASPSPKFLSFPSN